MDFNDGIKSTASSKPQTNYSSTFTASKPQTKYIGLSSPSQVRQFIGRFLAFKHIFKTNQIIISIFTKDICKICA